MATVAPDEMFAAFSVTADTREGAAAIALERYPGAGARMGLYSAPPIGALARRHPAVLR